MHTPGGILSQFTLKVSGQFGLCGRGDAGGDDIGLLENEELWSSGTDAGICGAEMVVAGMWKILTVLILQHHPCTFLHIVTA